MGTPEALTNGETATFAKEQLGVPQEGEATLLGLAWDKERDTISVKFPLDPAQPTKRGILGKVARVYDPLGLVSPMTLGGKLLYRDACNLHAFGDASGKGVAAAVYAVVTQPSGINQGLVAAKARLAKQGLTIPRLELISGHMVVNLIANVAKALEGFPVKQMHY